MLREIATELFWALLVFVEINLFVFLLCSTYVFANKCIHEARKTSEQKGKEDNQ